MYIVCVRCIKLPTELTQINKPGAGKIQCTHTSADFNTKFFYAKDKKIPQVHRREAGSAATIS